MSANNIVENKPFLIGANGAETLFSDNSLTINVLLNPKISKGMNALVMADGILLIVDGTNKTASIVNIYEETLKDLPNLLIKKSYFSLAFIGGLIPPSKVTSSVEVFDGGKWKSI